MEKFVMAILCVIVILMLFNLGKDFLFGVGSEENEKLRKIMLELLDELRFLNESQKNLITILKEIVAEPNLEELTLKELKELAKELKIKDYNKMNKAQLIDTIKEMVG